jgi:hypothetical protein
MCFDEDEACIKTAANAALLAPRFVSHRFKVSSSLLGQSGASQSFTAIIVPPMAQADITPASGMAENSSLIRQGGPF